MGPNPVLNPQEKCRYCFSYFPASKISQHEETCRMRPDGEDEGGRA